MNVRRTDIAACYRTACRFDVIAPKPGNVSVDSAGHRMVARQFLDAAAVSAATFKTAKHLGRAVFDATEVSVAVTGCNTNLGIVLLAAPIVIAAIKGDDSRSLRARLAELIDNTTIRDSAHVYAAIRLAEPGGLGHSDEHDVTDAPDLPLKEVMTYAADRDRIAHQYAHDFVDVFTVGVPVFEHFVSTWQSVTWATVACYLTFLGAFNDTHVERKFGNDAATDVRARAIQLERAFKACENPALFSTALRRFDEELKWGGVNPGTSADLTVASLMAWLIQGL